MPRKLPGGAVPRGEQQYKLPRGSVPRREQEYIGFFGCAQNLGGRVVRVRPPAACRRPPDRVFIKRCPACQHGHSAEPFWRRVQPDDTMTGVVIVEPYPGHH